MPRRKEPKLTGMKPYRQGDYQQFIRFMAMDSKEREVEYGFSKEKEFAAYYKVSPNTLTEWKGMQEFWDEVRTLVDQWGKTRIPNVLRSLYRKTIKDGGAPEVKLFLQRFDNFTEKSESTFSVHYEQLQKIEAATERLVAQESKRAKQPQKLWKKKNV